MPDSEPQTHSELASSFGEELRREREIRAISLKEIADATKISERFLDVIENDDYKTLPSQLDDLLAAKSSRTFALMLPNRHFRVLRGV